MEFLNLVQGSPEWHSERMQCGTASEAPAMMGRSKYMSRNALLDLKKSGISEEVTPQMQRLFDKGHAAEAKARPIIESMIGAELFPVTGKEVVEGFPLLASFDGLTMMGDMVFEHKLFNADLAESVRNEDLDAHYYWQLEQQLLVSGAEKAIFVVSDGTEENMVYMWYEPVLGRAEMLLAGWHQFFIDLESHELTSASVAPELVGRAPDSLPALRIEVQGMVSASNLAEFKEHALAVFAGINKDLQTDRDFADAKKTVKWCKDVEERLESAKAHALSQTSDIDALFRTIDTIKEEARTTRLELDKLVKHREKAIRDEIWQQATAAFVAHIHQINAGLNGVRMPDVTADFAAAMKGKKTVTGLRDGADTELARAKVAANQIADKIRANLAILAEAAEHAALFADRQHLVLKEADDLRNLIATRITNHQQAEEVRLERERVRIREEERKRAEENERIRATAEEQAKQREQEDKTELSGNQDGQQHKDPECFHVDAPQSATAEHQDTEVGRKYPGTLFYAEPSNNGGVLLQTVDRNYRLTFAEAEMLRDSLDAALKEARGAA
jgi:predicted phage-related endonuclease